MSVKRKKAPAQAAGSQGIRPQDAATLAFTTATGALMLGALQDDQANAREALDIVAATPTSDARGQADGERSDTRSDDSRDAGASHADHGSQVMIQEQIASQHLRDGQGIAALAAAQPHAGAAGNADGKDGPAPPHPSGETESASPLGAAHDAEGAAAGLPPEHGSDHDAAVAHQGPPPTVDTDTLAAHITNQITGAISQISSGLGDGLSPDEIGQSIAAGISETVSGITRQISAGILSGGNSWDNGQNGAGAGISDTFLGTTGDLASDVGTAVDDILAHATTDLAPNLEGFAADVSHIPSSILGAEDGDSLPGGLLSDIFYSDGESAIPASPAGGAAALPAAAPSIDGIAAKLTDDAGGMAASLLPAAAEATNLSSAPAVPQIIDDAASAAADDGPASDAVSDGLSDATTVLVGAGDAVHIDFAGLSYVEGADMPHGGLSALHLL